MDFTQFVESLTQQGFRHVAAFFIFVIIFIVYKYLSGFVSSSAKRLELEPHASNLLRLLLRVAAIFSTLLIMCFLYELPTTVFISGSALVGALLGFGSAQTINNIVAGFYVLISQPFKVKDYVKIGESEGQVEGVSINYTSLYTPTFNLLKIPNTQVMNNKVLNMTHEGFIKYTFDVGFSHDLSSNFIMDKCVIPAIEEFYERHIDEVLRKPEAYIKMSDRLGFSVLIRFFIPKGNAKQLYTLKPILLDLVSEKWYEISK
jgi:small conductance mechanosensitive channel